MLIFIYVHLQRERDRKERALTQSPESFPAGTPISSNVLGPFPGFGAFAGAMLG
jgi:hypothetical protein